MDVRAGVGLTAEEDFAFRPGGRLRDAPARREIGDEFRPASAIASAAESPGSPIGEPPSFPAVFDLASLDGTNGFRIDGIDSYDVSGRSVASGGDVNGDGFDDLIIGAYRAYPNGDALAGESYVVFGSGAGFASAIDLASLDGSNGFRIDGIDAGDRSGFSVASAGDVNGDGFDDVIVGAYAADHSGDSDAGESYVVFGSGAGFAAAVDLAGLNGSNGFRINGIDQVDRSGFSVASAGDVNGDGFDDVIVGAHLADPNADSAAGESYVVFGSGAGFAAAIDLADLDGSNGFRIDGIDADDLSGRAVASAGDVNGDGFDDVIVGAHGADPNGDSYAGESYVVFGSGAGFAATVDLTALDGSNGFRLNGIDAYDRSGFSVASAGDVNGDGFDDVIIGAQYADPGGDGEAGESYVVFGSGAGFAASLDLAALDGDNGFRLDGIDPADVSGTSVASAGDVNGDGFDDVIVGAHFADPNGDSRAGESYVVFGKAEGFAASINLAALNGSNGFRLEGIDGYDYSGRSVASAGDLNGDGFGDLVIGAYRADPGGDLAAGASYVVFGRAPDSDVHRRGSIAAQMISGGVGDDTLEGLGGGDTLRGQGGDDSLNGGSGDDSIEGGDGVDAIQGGSGNDVVLGGAGSDEALLGSGNDIADGGSGADTLKGSDGNDALTGGAGGDLLAGGEGIDLASYATSAAAVNVDLAGAASGGDAAGDSLSGIENLTGSDKHDTLTGNASTNSIKGGKGNDSLSGNGGADTLEGGKGGDTLDGGSGIDWASYAKAPAAVRADLETPASNTGEAAGDSYVDIENLLGGAFNDSLHGDAGANELSGGNGDDSLLGRGGADVFTGGAGADRFTLASTNAGDFETIADFTGADEIALLGSVYGLAPGALAPG
ncbi:MAG: FG-GAP repeat protein, partial [Sphingomonadaceae bacterium]|nr:FG-GAP repeat protein [Sphingomonadaceae bacterium]